LQRTDARLAVDLVAPAKVNLALHVTGRRDDGYHLIESLVVFCADGDRLRIATADQDRFGVTGPFAPALDAGDSNLVVRARDLLRNHAGSGAPVAIELEKSLPIASGLGGGSSDAATTLRALSCVWGMDREPSDLARLAAGLGADLPMCLAARPLVARGIGERIETLDGFPALDMLLLNPGLPVSTPAVFAGLARRDNEGLPPPEGLTSVEAVCTYLRATRNDLQQPAIASCPAIADVLDALTDQAPLFARMSGSGATCFAIFPDRATAARAGERIAARHPDWFVLATRTLPSPDGAAYGRP
jgi:4-diphosphocytidyl-2-C-methyl-D-erythritol kinase